VKFSEITEVIRGQKTKVFLQNPIPEHKDLSFSLVYGKDRTLDLVCKVTSLVRSFMMIYFLILFYFILFISFSLLLVL